MRRPYVTLAFERLPKRGFLRWIEGRQDTTECVMQAPVKRKEGAGERVFLAFSKLYLGRLVVHC